MRDNKVFSKQIHFIVFTKCYMLAESPKTQLASKPQVRKNSTYTNYFFPKRLLKYNCKETKMNEIF